MSNANISLPLLFGYNLATVSQNHLPVETILPHQLTLIASSLNENALAGYCFSKEFSLRTWSRTPFVEKKSNRRTNTTPQEVPLLYCQSQLLQLELLRFKSCQKQSAAVH